MQPTAGLLLLLLGEAGCCLDDFAAEFRRELSW
jgi:hypothetical protein